MAENKNYIDESKSNNIQVVLLFLKTSLKLIVNM